MTIVNRIQLMKKNCLLIVFIIIIILLQLALVQEITSKRNESYLTLNSIADISGINTSELIDFSTYLGGTGDEKGVSAELDYLGDSVVDSEGNIIVVGRSAANDFPIKSAYQSANAGSIDATVSKFSPDGSLIFSTYLGGSEDDWANCVAVDSNNNIVIGGVTGSADFPLENPYQDTLLGGTESDADIFIAKLSKDGSDLIYSTFFGGTGSDWCYSIDVDDNNRIAFTGTTASAVFPLANAYQTTNNGNLEAYATLLAANGQSLLFSTFIGSSNFDNGRGITCDSTGAVYVTGQMGDAALGTEGVFQKNPAGSIDAFLAKFLPNGNLEYFTFLGGTGYDRGNDLKIDDQGNVVLVGFTISYDFPLENPWQNLTKGSREVFITKFNGSGEDLIFSTFLGGSDEDYGFGITLDDDNDIIITGQTKSSNFPSYLNFGFTLGSSECFLAKYHKNGTLLFSNKIGGTSLDLGVEISYHSEDSIIIVGFTYSTNFPVSNAYQSTYGGACDLFVIKINTIDLDINQIIAITDTTSQEAAIFNADFIILFSLIPMILLQKKRKRK